MALGIRNIPKEVQPAFTSPESQMAAAESDPNSLAAISRRTQVLAAQAIADSQYDPPVPPPTVAGFCNYRRPESLLYLLLILALLIIGMLALTVMGPSIQRGIGHLIPTIRSRR